METLRYRDLSVWRRARQLAVDVYRQTRIGNISRDWSLRDQLRRAALSAPSNIAEGTGRGSSRDYVRFLWIARGSLAELATQAEIAEELGLLPLEIAQSWQEECHQIAAMITRLIQTRGGAYDT
jgi:four helix bundle protein